MGGSCQGIKSLRSSRVHGHWQIVKVLNDDAKLEEADKTKGDLIFSARRVKFTLFQAFSVSARGARGVHDETAHRGHGSIDTGLTPKFLVVYRIIPAYPKEFATWPQLIGKPGNAPTPKPSPLIGLRRSTLRRESNA